MENEIGDIYYIVDWSETDCKKLLLEPIRRRCNLHSLDCRTCISRSAVSSDNLHRNCTFRIIVRPCGNIRKIELARNSIMFKICIQVACDSDMRGGIHTVCRKTDLYDGVSCETEIIFCRCSHNSFLFKNHDTVMRLSDSKFILSADHTE